MIRTILATTALVAAIAWFVPEAQACVSCEYKPEVLGNSEASPRVKKRMRVNAAVKARKPRPEKERVVSRKKRPVHAAEKAQPNDEKTKAASDAKGEVASPRAQSVYNTLIKTTEPADIPAVVAPPVTQPVTPPAATVDTTAKEPAKPVATADSAPVAALKDDTPDAASATESANETVTVSQQKGDKAKGCKKFFPMADLTLTVDCK